MQRDWPAIVRNIMTQPGLLRDLPGGDAPLMAIDDPRLEKLVRRTLDNPPAFRELWNVPRSYKLGIQFESLVLWGLIEGLGYTCLGKDVQIQNSERTLGALDLVLRTPDNRIEHWELAYKLFLGFEPRPEWKYWIGPGERDRLDLKVRRMLDHQLPLSTRPEASTALRRLGVQHIDRHRVLLQGVLFSPWPDRGNTTARGTAHSRGRWLHVSKLDELISERPNSMWTRRPKPAWFGPWFRPEEPGISIQALATELRTRPIESPDLWVCREPDSHRVPEPFFLVPDGWGRQTEKRK